MALSPQGVALDGLITLHNFTHYDTDDLVRALEAPLMARRRSAVLDPHTVPTVKTEIHICYGMATPAGGSKVKLIGHTWRHNGIRIAQPHKLHDNPVDALSDTSKELPLNVVRELLHIMSNLYGGRASYDRYRGTRNDIDIDTLALGIRIGIHPTTAGKKPRGYRRTAYARANCERSARRAYYLSARGAKALGTAGRALARLHYHAPHAGLSDNIPPDIQDRILRLRREAEELSTTLYEIYMASQERA